MKTDKFGVALVVMSILVVSSLSSFFVFKKVILERKSVASLDVDTQATMSLSDFVNNRAVLGDSVDSSSGGLVKAYRDTISN